MTNKKFYILLTCVILLFLSNVLTFYYSQTTIKELRANLDTLNNQTKKDIENINLNFETERYEKDHTIKIINEIIEVLEEVSLNTHRTTPNSEYFYDIVNELFEIKGLYHVIIDYPQYKNKNEEEMIAQAKKDKDYRDAVIIKKYNDLIQLTKNYGIQYPEYFLEQFGKMSYSIPDRYRLTQQLFNSYTKK
jgi:hypothetical protein